MNLLNKVKYVLGLDDFLEGIDTSHWEHQVDWIKVKEQNFRFVFMKASQGIAVDPDFKRMWAEAKGIFPRGAYHFYDGLYSSNEPERQVDTFLKQVDGDYGELPFVVDLEGVYAIGDNKHNYPYVGWRKWYDYLEGLKKKVPEKEIIIYTSPYLWRDNTPAVGSAQLNYFKQYPLWIAHYGVNTPLVPAPWGNWLTGDWTFWQYTENGWVDGVNDAGHQTTVDLNYYNGDENKFRERFNLSEIMEADMLVTVREGAQVFSSNENLTPWGYIEQLGAAAKEPMHVSNVYKDRYFINDPLWPKNQKPFAVYQKDCTEVVEPTPEPEPEPQPEPTAGDIQVNISFKKDGYPDFTVNEIWKPLA